MALAADTSGKAPAAKYQALLKRVKQDEGETRLKLTGISDPDDCRAFVDALQTNTRLQELDLGSSTFGDVGIVMLAPVIAKHPGLDRLFLYEQNISDKAGVALMEALANSARIQRIDLSSNQLGDGSAAAIANFVEQSTSLVSLKLDFNNFTNAGLATILSAVGRSRSITQLMIAGLKNTSLTGIKDVFAGLNGNTTITQFHCDVTKIGDDGAAALADWLAGGAVATIQMMNLRYGGIGSAGAAALAKVLARANALHTLILGFNPLGDAGVKVVAEALTGRECLRSLTFNTVEMGDVGATAVAAMLKDPASAVRDCPLAKNNIGDTGAIAIGEALNAPSFALVKLALGRNRITATGMEAIANGLSRNKSVLQLELYRNQLGDSAAVAAGNLVKGATMLRKLDISDNHVSDGVCTAIAAALGGNTALKSLNVRNNVVGDDGAHALSNALLKRTPGGAQMQLDLRNNHIGPFGSQSLSLVSHVAVVLYDRVHDSLAGKAVLTFKRMQPGLAFLQFFTDFMQFVSFPFLIGVAWSSDTRFTWIPLFFTSFQLALPSIPFQSLFSVASVFLFVVVLAFLPVRRVPGGFQILVQYMAQWLDPAWVQERYGSERKEKLDRVASMYRLVPGAAEKRATLLASLAFYLFLMTGWAATGVMFLPIARVIFSQLDCSSTADGWIWDIDGTTVCWQGAHLVGSVISVVTIIAWGLTTFRLAGVNGFVDKTFSHATAPYQITPVARNWNLIWPGDQPDTDYEHVFSRSHYGVTYGRGLFLVKALLAAFTVFQSSNVTLLTIVYLLASILLLAATMVFAPYHNQTTNHWRFGLNLAVIWINFMAVIVHQINDAMSSATLTSSVAAALGLLPTAVIGFAVAHWLVPRSFRGWKLEDLMEHPTTVTDSQLAEAGKGSADTSKAPQRASGKSPSKRRGSSTGSSKKKRRSASPKTDAAIAAVVPGAGA